MTTGCESPGGFPTDLYYEISIIDRVAKDNSSSGEESFGPVVLDIGSME